MKYIIQQQAIIAITDFYRNVMNKYKHTYSLDDYYKDVDDAFDKINLIETKDNQVRSNVNMQMLNTKLFQKWTKLGYSVAASKKWYYAYIKDENIITIYDACHQQNNENLKAKNNIYINESLIYRISNIVKNSIDEAFESL